MIPWLAPFFRQRRRGARFEKFLDRVIGMLKVPAPDTPQLIYRIQHMERDIVLPVKAAGIVMVLYSFYFSPWIGITLGALEIAVEGTQYFLWIYIGINLVVAGMLLAMRWLPLALIEWSVFMISLIDGIFLSALTLVTGGADSILDYVFLCLIVRSAASVPRATSQLMLNLTLSACYVFAGIIDVAIAANLNYPGPNNSGQVLIEVPDRPTEQLLLRLILLLLMTLCCYAVQVLLEHQRQALDQAREFAVREGQLRSAGRLAAEFAHQIKNPLAIINNAAFSLQRALRDGKAISSEQIGIIQEEVQRSDRVVTQIMGYAQLTEGRVEKLDVFDEIERAITQVFPSAMPDKIKIHRE